MGTGGAAHPGRVMQRCAPLPPLRCRHDTRDAAPYISSSAPPGEPAAPPPPPPPHLRLVDRWHRASGAADVEATLGKTRRRNVKAAAVARLALQRAQRGEGGGGGARAQRVINSGRHTTHHRRRSGSGGACDISEILRATTRAGCG